MVRMFSAASSYVFTTASNYVYGPAPPPSHQSATVQHSKKKRRPRKRQADVPSPANGANTRPSSSGRNTEDAENEPPSSSSSSGPSSSRGAKRDDSPVGGTGGGGKKRKGGEVGAAFDMVDAINEERDLYRVLGLARGAKTEDIRRAYIARSRICHPDKLPTYGPCTPAFQKLSFAYETLSKPSSRRLYDVSGGREFSYGGDSGRHTNPSFGDETLNGVLYSTFVEFMDGDFEMIRVLVNALNEGNPGLNLGEDAIANLESALRRLRSLLLAGQKYVRVVRFELIRLYEIQQTLRGLSYFNIPGRLRLTLQLARVTLSIPMKVDRAMREGIEDELISGESEKGNGVEGGKSSGGGGEGRGLLPRGVAGLLGATVAVLEKGEKVTMWGSGQRAEDFDPPSSTS